jgi:membrane protease YdiL (CAAX protease family)
MTSDDLTPEPWLDEVIPADEPESKPDLMVALPAPQAPHPNIWWSLLWCFGILATLYGTIIVAMVAGMVGKDVYARIRGEKQPVISTDRPLSPEEREKANAARLAKLKEDLFRSLAIPMFLGEVVTTLLAVATLRIFVGKNWMRIVGMRRPGLLHVALVLIALPAMLVLPNMIHELAKYVGVPHFDNPEEFAQMIGGWSLGFGVLVIGVGPGLSEELWCRGFLGRGLVGNYGVWLGVLLTSALFGLMHLDPAHAIATAAIGIWLHFTYLMSRSLIVPMILHTLNNSLAVIGAVVGIQLDAWQKNSENASPPSPLWEQVADLLNRLEKLASHQPYLMSIGCIFLLGGVACALYMSRVRLVVSADETQLPWRPDFQGVEYPPSGSVTKVYRPWPGWLASGLVLAGIIAFAGCSYYAYLQS